MNEPIYQYPFDPTGTDSSNLVTGEVHLLSPSSWDDYRFIVPNFAPFFSSSIVVTHEPSGDALQEGVDYVLGFKFLDASRLSGRSLYGALYILNKDLVGSVVINYQTLGGEWAINQSVAAELMANVAINPRITSWEQVVNPPNAFPVIDHQFDVVDLVGASELVSSLDAIRDAIANPTQSGPSESVHALSKDNPHETTKAHVGLGNVDNYSRNDYDQRYAQQDGDYTDLRARGTTKEDVGLGNLVNYGIATDQEALAGSNTKYSTPHTVNVQIENSVQPFVEEDVIGGVKAFTTFIGDYSKTLPELIESIDQGFDSVSNVIDENTNLIGQQSFSIADVRNDLNVTSNKLIESILDNSIFKLATQEQNLSFSFAIQAIQTETGPNSALAQSIEALGSIVNDETQSNQAKFNQVNLTFANLDTVISSQKTELEAKIESDVSGAVQTMSANVTDSLNARIGYCSIGGDISGHDDMAACMAAGGTWNTAPLAEVIRNARVQLPDGSVATVSQLAQAFVDSDGSIVAKGALITDVNGRISGLYNTNTGASSDLDLIAEKVRIGDVDNTGDFIPLVTFDSGDKVLVIRARVVLEDGTTLKTEEDLLPTGVYSVLVVYAEDANGTNQSLTAGDRKYVQYYEYRGTAPSLPVGGTFVKFIGDDGEPVQAVWPIFADNVNGDNQSFSATGKRFVTFYENIGKPELPVNDGFFVQYVGNDGGDGLPGTDGASVLIVYAENEAGANQSLIQGNKKYVQYVEYVKDAPALPVTGTFVKFIGDDGEPASSVWPIYADASNGAGQSFSSSGKKYVTFYESLTQPILPVTGATFVKYVGDDGIPGAKGADGADGTDARTVKLTANKLAMKYSTAGTNPNPSTITFTAEAFNTQGNLTYRFFVNDVAQGIATTNNSFTYNAPSSMVDDPVSVEVELFEAGSLVARDEVTIVSLRDGSSAITIVMSNESHSVPSNSDGSQPALLGSGTNIRVFEGNVPLEFNTTATSAPSVANPGKYNVSRNLTGLTATAMSGGGTTTLVSPDYTDMTSDAASATFTIRVRRLDGTTEDFTKVQTLTKSKRGTDGNDGTPGAPGAPGNPGTDGASVLIVYASDSSGSDQSLTQGSRRYIQYVEYSGTQPTLPVTGTFVKFIGDDGEPATSVWSVYADNVGGSGQNFSPSGKKYVTFYESITQPILPVSDATFVKYVGDDGIPGAKGADGADGLNARAVKLVADKLALKYSTAGTNPTPSLITFIAQPFNAVGNLTYRFFVNDVAQGPASGSDTFTYTAPSSMVDQPTSIEVELYENGSLVARDEVAVVSLRDGSSAITIVMSNESHSVPSNANGSNPQLTGSGTTIRVFEGNTPLSFNGSSGSNPPTGSLGTYNVDRTMSGLTSNAMSGVGTTTLTQPNYTGMSVDVASAVFTIRVRRLDGTTETFTKVQTLTKSKRGTDGNDGTPGAPGAPGNPGTDGASVLVVYAETSSGTNQSLTAGDRKYVQYYEYTGSTPPLPVTGTFVKFIGDDGEPANGIWPIYADNASGSNQSFSSVDKRYVTFYESVVQPTLPVSGATFTKYVGDDGIPGAAGADGADGRNARTVVLTADKLAIKYSNAGVDPNPTTINFEAVAFGAEGALAYRFFIDDIAQGAAGSSNTFTYTAPSVIDDTPKSFEVELYENGELVARDEVMVVSLRDGSGALTMLLSNETHAVPTDEDGNNPDLTASGTQVRVYDGTTLLLFEPAGVGAFPPVGNNGRFSAERTVSGISHPPMQGAGTSTLILPDATAMTSDIATVVITLRIRRLDGTTVMLSKTQTLTKVRRGSKGDPGEPGPSGTPSPGFFSSSYTTINWSTGTANSRFSNVSVAGRAPINGDIFIQSRIDGTQVSGRRYNASTGTWVDPGMFLSGDFIATGTVAGDRFIAGTEISAPKIVGGEFVGTTYETTPNAGNVGVLINKMGYQIYIGTLDFEDPYFYVKDNGENYIRPSFLPPNSGGGSVIISEFIKSNTITGFNGSSGNLSHVTQGNRIDLTAETDGGDISVSGNHASGAAIQYTFRRNGSVVGSRTIPMNVVYYDDLGSGTTVFSLPSKAEISLDAGLPAGSNQTLEVTAMYSFPLSVSLPQQPQFTVSLRTFEIS